MSCRLFDEKTQSIYNDFLADPLSEDELIDHIRILQQKVTTAKQDGRCNGSKKYKQTFCLGSSYFPTQGLPHQANQKSHKYHFFQFFLRSVSPLTCFDWCEYILLACLY